MTALPDGYALITLDSIDSTNEEAKRVAAADRAGNGIVTVIRANEQTAGKARRGRGWVSRPGNLYCSLLLIPDCPVAQTPQYGFVAGIALREVVAALLPRERAIACKWPNDLLVDGRKVAGVLLEGAGVAHQSLDWLVIGVGANIEHHPDGTEFPATDLTALGGIGITPEYFLSQFVAAFERWRRRWREEGFGAVRQSWLAVAHGRGSAITVRLDGSTFSGVFADLDTDGALVLDQGHTVRRVTAGDVFFAAI
jgi:BirA family transcriptional regulator, biotin operon repressor / biotin---[acetyl-CoA-carboxylase] ligase